MLCHSVKARCLIARLMSTTLPACDAEDLDIQQIISAGTATLA